VGVRHLKTVHLEVRPIHHRLEERVRAHAFVCMLAYHVVWNIRRALAPLLFQDDDPATAGAERRSVVPPARRWPRARRKAETMRTDDGFPVHSHKGFLIHGGQELRFSRNTVHLVLTACFMAGTLRRKGGEPAWRDVVVHPRKSGSSPSPT
jgi:hypothetical protein